MQTDRGHKRETGRKGERRRAGAEGGGECAMNVEVGEKRGTRGREGEMRMDEPGGGRRGSRRCWCCVLGGV